MGEAAVAARRGGPHVVESAKQQRDKIPATRAGARDARQAAREYIGRGWKVIDIPAGAKRPARLGWQHAQLTADDIDPGGNVGLLLGEPGAGLVDVDLDAGEAIAAAPYLLLQTQMRHGRPSKKSSHWWYVVDMRSMRTCRYRDPDGSTLVELRAAGGQTIVPPSVHPEGERLEWEDEGEPARAPAEALRDAVARVAAVAMIARRWPDGSRHDAALALAGHLLRGGLLLSDVERIVEAVARVADDPEWHDRVRCVAETAAALAAGDAATGGPRLAELLPDGAAVVKRVTQWLALRVAAPGTGADATDGGHSARQRSAVLVRLADVQPESVAWLWYPYIPRGKITILEGDPAAGKTWLALALAAAVSRGCGLPDAADSGRPNAMTCEPGQVIYLTAEDGLADTLRPRLDAVGADASRAYALTAAHIDGIEVAITLRDLDVLNDALTQTHAALLVVDPVQGFLGSQIDMHRANEVRPVLAGLAKLGEQHNCAIVCIRHLSKANADRALYRGLGSIDFTAAARSVLLAGRDPTDANRRALVQIKNSLAPEGPALAYAINGGRFEWAGLSEMTSAALLARDASDDDRGALDEAREWLADALVEGPRTAKDMQHDARAAGIAAATLRRAQRALGVQVRRTGGVGGAGHWEWSLPSKMLMPESERLSASCDAEGAESADRTSFFPDAAKMLKPMVLNGDEHLSVGRAGCSEAARV